MRGFWARLGSLSETVKNSQGLQASISLKTKNFKMCRKQFVGFRRDELPDQQHVGYLYDFHFIFSGISFITHTLRCIIFQYGAELVIVLQKRVGFEALNYSTEKPSPTLNPFI